MLLFIGSKFAYTFHFILLPDENFDIFLIPGYYRVNYDTYTWRLIAKTLKEDHLAINELNRAQVSIKINKYKTEMIVFLHDFLY